MKSVALMTFVASFALAASVHAANPASSVETNSHNRVLPGSKICDEDAFRKASSVIEAIVLEHGIDSPGAPGEAYHEGMRIEVLQNHKGKNQGKMSVDLLFRTLPAEEAESVPGKGEKVLLFLGGDGLTSNRVRKALLSTDSNNASILRIKERK